jgi:hypothetical protein
MSLAKVLGACLITLGIALLALQIAWVISGQMKTLPAGKKAAHDYKHTPYPGIAGVALVVGGIGFMFMARRGDGPRPRHLNR